MSTPQLTEKDITISDDNLPDDFNALQAIGLSQVAKMLRGKSSRGGAARSLAVESVRRFILKGATTSGGGPLVRLRAVRLNGEYLCMESWVREFEEERARLGRLQPLANEPSRRTREAERKRAETVLDKAGIGRPKEGKRGRGR